MIEYTRKKFVDEITVLEGLSYDQPFDPEHWDPEDMVSNASCDKPRDLDEKHGGRKRDGDDYREIYGYRDSDEGLAMCRGVNWT